MTNRDPTAEPNAKTLADLSALADGTLDPARAQAVRELIAGSPELGERYARELRAIEALHTTRSDFAPPRLRARIEAQRRQAERPRRGLVFGGSLAAAAAAVVAALALLVPGASLVAPSVSQAAALALRGAASSAPLPDQSGAKLRRDVQEVYFPNWSRSFQWTATGQRSDRLDGKRAVTVYYGKGNTQIAYTILTAPALRWPGAQTHLVNGTELQSFRLDGRLVVTWRRANHTCVLSGSGVSLSELTMLATWKTPGLSS
jgi:hypothetical protein